MNHKEPFFKLSGVMIDLYKGIVCLHMNEEDEGTMCLWHIGWSIGIVTQQWAALRWSCWESPPRTGEEHGDDCVLLLILWHST